MGLGYDGVFVVHKVILGISLYCGALTAAKLNDKTVSPIEPTVATLYRALSARVPRRHKITDSGLTRSITGCFIAVLYSYGNSGRQ